MKCPVCDIALTMSERQGIEVDYCPQCRGVWLDRGELDKIIERAAGAASYTPESGHVRRHPDEYRDHPDAHQGRHRRHKRKSFLGELFDFD